MTTIQKKLYSLDGTVIDHYPDENLLTYTLKGKSVKNASNRLVFCVDLSGSMADYLCVVKEELLRFQDCAENIVLIGFHDEVEKFYPSAGTRWSDAVNDMECGMRTNLGDALLTAFGECSDEGVNTIVVMTDGLANCGCAESSYEFEQLMIKKPENSRVVSLGYRDDFDYQILQLIGDYTHVQNDEMLAHIITNLFTEWQTLYRCEPIVIPDKKYVIGSPPKWMWNGRKYIFACIVDDDDTELTIEKLPESVLTLFVNVRSAEFMLRVCIAAKESSLEKLNYLKAELRLKKWYTKNRRLDQMITSFINSIKARKNTKRLLNKISSASSTTLRQYYHGSTDIE